ncbi:MAG: hypothetical protein LBB14_02765 [Puniceicoccales bacterium]|nr:hypothetical protein [Puniceicoccales bacterium]
MAHGELYYDVPLGAFPGEGGTLFRIFAPNAFQLSIRFGSGPGGPDGTLSAREIAEGLWEAATDRDLRNFSYAIAIEPKNRFAFSASDFAQILDPYGLACRGAGGPAIAVDRNALPRAEVAHGPAPLGDLVLLEGHLRDLLGLSSSGGRATYGAFSRWLEEKNNYLLSLGINALELQPLQEMEGTDGDSYRWGYMPTNYFSPTWIYASNRADGSQIGEFAELIRSCHRRSLAFVLDVVYNHVGNPNALRLLGGDYYFRTCADGSLSNCSGCGNDLRTEAPMARRLILDSLEHLISTYGVDGFRFDLAELIDGETRRAIEERVRRIRPDAILIAEPWSFRGHCAYDMRESSWSCWNDDFRDSIRRYVLGQSGRDALHYFAAGCTGHLTRIALQSVNYTASHDDFCWIDGITENARRDGTEPTERDIRRSRLMFAILFTCLGVPMVAEGQDFLHSKGGQCNTYEDGERNLLRPERLVQFRDLHRQVAGWIRFRISEAGRPLRLPMAPPEGFFRYFPARDSSSATAILYNADGAGEGGRLLFLINPEEREVFFDLSGLPERGIFRLVTDGEHFVDADGAERIGDGRRLGPIGCELWASATPAKPTV